MTLCAFKLFLWLAEVSHNLVALIFEMHCKRISPFKQSFYEDLSSFLERILFNDSPNLALVLLTDRLFPASLWSLSLSVRLRLRSAEIGPLSTVLKVLPKGARWCRHSEEEVAPSGTRLFRGPFIVSSSWSKQSWLWSHLCSSSESELFSSENLFTLLRRRFAALVWTHSVELLDNSPFSGTFLQENLDLSTPGLATGLPRSPAALAAGNTSSTVSSRPSA